MSSQYKDNIFSTENLSTSHARSQNNIDKTERPNIDHLMKRILVEKRREKRNSMAIVFLTLSTFSIFIFLNIT